MIPKVMNGARAKVGIVDPNTGDFIVSGIYTQVSFGLNFQVEPAFILGRYSAAALDYTAQDIISINCSGWRVIDHGAHVEGRVPSLKDLLTHDYLTMAIIDRATAKKIGTMRYVRPIGYDTSLAARQLEEMSMRYAGIYLDDESTVNSERFDSTSLPG